VFRRLIQSKGGVVGIVLIGALLLIAVLAPVIAPYSTTKQSFAIAFRTPDREHLLGTDSYGRDILSRVIFGARVSLKVAILATGVGLLVGSTLGLVAGYFGGWVDHLIQWIADISWAFPTVLYALVLTVIIGPGLWTALMAIGLSYWARFERLIRAEVLVTREQDFVEAAQAIGSSDAGIILRHIVPNSTASTVVVFTLIMGQAIAEEAMLSFLGIGTQPPTPSWGLMLAEGREFITNAPWITIFPGIAIALVVIGFSLLGDGIRDALDPRLKGVIGI